MTCMYIVGPRSISGTQAIDDIAGDQTTLRLYRSHVSTQLKLERVKTLKEYENATFRVLLRCVNMFIGRNNTVAKADTLY